MRATVAPCAASRTHTTAPTGSSTSATPGTYSDGVSTVAPARHSASPNSAVRTARAISPSERGYPLQRVAYDRGALVGAGPRRQQQPVREHRAGHPLDIVRQRVVSPLDGGKRLRRAEQHQPGA